MSIENDLKRIADALELQCKQVAWIHNVPADLSSAKPAAAAVETAVDTTAKKKKTETAPPAAAGGQLGSAPVVITEQVLREALRQYIIRHETKGKGKGMEAATELLTKFKAKTVSSIKKEDYEEIVQVCEKDRVAYETKAAKK